ncbi:hypothetical protein A2U01_0113120, partial [Trifolium medium]|nr:hypothetical protein [Trifolium medium]
MALDSLESSQAAVGDGLENAEAAGLESVSKESKSSAGSASSVSPLHSCLT